MKKYTTWFSVLLFCAYVLPASAEYFNVNARNLVVKESPYVDVRAYASGTVGIPDDGLDDAAAFVSSLSGGNKTVLIPDGEWTIGGTTQFLTVEDNTTIIMGRYAVLNFTGTDASYRYGFRMNGKSHIKIFGGRLNGNRATQSSGNGIGIMVTGGSNDIWIEDVYAQDWYTDGFYVGGGVGDSYNVTWKNLTSYNSRRNGGAITGSVYDMLVDGCTFDNTNGTSPQVGLDIEPDAGEVTRQITVVNSTFKNNTSHGAFIQDGAGATSRVIWANNKSYGNGGYGYAVSGVDKGTAGHNDAWNNTLGGWYFSTASNWDVNGGTMDNNAINLEVNNSTDLSFGGGLKLLNSVADDGAVVRLHSGRITLKGLQIRGSGANGVNLDNVYDSIIESNTITNSQQSGIRTATAVDNTSIKNNIIKDNRAVGSGSYDGIQMGATNYCHVTGNVVRGAHRYGILVGPSAVGNVVMFNDLLDAAVVSGSWSDSGSGTITYYDNTYTNWNRVN